MNSRYSRFLAVVISLLSLNPAGAQSGKVTGWLDWRGPTQNGVSTEKNLPMKLDESEQVWTYGLAGRGTPVIAGDRVYVWGFRGEGPNLQEVIACLDAKSGKPVWELGFNDFLSDIVYDRYSIGSPVVDPETGNIYALTSAGIFAGISPEGKILWQHSMMEAYGRLTFPNGRTGSPAVDGEFVIVHGIISNWGAEGPARDRFYAFMKKTGELVWSATAGVTPKDSSFSTPVFGWNDGKRVLYCGTGDGSILCLNSRNGEALWRFAFSKGGVNVTPVLYGKAVVGIHIDENLDAATIGRMVAVDTTAKPVPSKEPGVAPDLPASAELWRNDLKVLSSSAVPVGDRIYQVTKTGDLCSVDAKTGKVFWKEKVCNEQLHASPLYGDGKLYVPVLNGDVFVIEPGADKPKILSKRQLDGNCTGAPAVWAGRMFIMTSKKVYCFSAKGEHPVPALAAAEEPKIEKGPAAQLQIIPAEVALQAGGKASFTVRSIDANGFVVDDNVKAAEWKSFIPPTAKVKAEMDASFEDGKLVVKPEARVSAGAFQATSGSVKGTIRGRVIPSLPYRENFDSYQLTTAHQTESGVMFAYPPLPWIGARFKWEVREREGEKVLTKTLDNTLFQRAMTFLGSPEMKDYTVTADVLSDGNRRLMSSVGVINQRYLIALSGNSQELEVTSNYERVRQSVPFPAEPNVWYTLKTRVDVAPDGSGVVRAKVWKRGETEPEKWSIEVPHQRAHRSGSPGLFGFALQSRFRVYIDNISITPNQ